MEWVVSLFQRWILCLVQIVSVCSMIYIIVRFWKTLLKYREWVIFKPIININRWPIPINIPKVLNSIMATINTNPNTSVSLKREKGKTNSRSLNTPLSNNTTLINSLINILVSNLVTIATRNSSYKLIVIPSQNIHIDYKCLPTSTTTHSYPSCRLISSGTNDLYNFYINYHLLST